jgi:uncharacterized protein YukE
VTSTEASQDPEVFLTQVDDALEEVVEKINEFLEASETLFNTAIKGAQAHIMGGIPGAIVGGIKGLLTGGIPGAIQGQIEGYIDGLLQEFNEGTTEIHVQWEEAEAAIRQSIGSLAGDPLMMSAISSAYRDAAEVLGNQGNEIISANKYVAARWSGDAYIAYESTADLQLKALSATLDTMLNAAQLMDDHQEALLNYWSGQLKNLVDLTVAITSEIAELGDAGNWLSGGVGPLIKAFASTIGGAATIVDTAVTHWTGLNIGKAGDWDGLQAYIPEAGLENNVWPEFTHVDRSKINGPWQKS